MIKLKFCRFEPKELGKAIRNSLGISMILHLVESEVHQWACQSGNLRLRKSDKRFKQEWITRKWLELFVWNRFDCWFQVFGSNIQKRQSSSKMRLLIPSTSVVFGASMARSASEIRSQSTFLFALIHSCLSKFIADLIKWIRMTFRIDSNWCFGFGRVGMNGVA